MPFLTQIVCKINNSLSVTALKAGLIDGIAYQVTKKTEAGDQLFPAIFDGGLVERYIGIDDSNSTIVYHRQIRNTYRKNPQIPNRYTQTTQMLMVVYANKNLLQVQTPDALESLIIKSFPTRYEPAQLVGLEGLDDVNISVIGSEMNPATVFAGEYRNVPYRLSPDEIYFSVSYQLDIQFDNNCLDECAPDNPDSLCDWVELATAQQIYDCMSEAQQTGLAELICTEATAELYDTANNLISTTDITCGLTEPITAPDGTINLVNTDNDPIQTETVRSNQTKSATIPNVAWTDSDGSAESTPYGNAIVCTPQSSLTVDFSANDTTPQTNQVVTFTDATVGATTWLWDFGDGELSDLQNPTHEYKYAGTYSVTLHADTGAVGGFLKKTNYITVTLQTVFQTNLQMHNLAPVGAAPSNLTIIAGNVSQWNDETANAFHRTQAVVAGRPFYSSGGYVSPSGVIYGTIDYDGVNEAMRNTNVAFTRATGSYEIVVIKLNSMLVNQVPFEAGNAFAYELFINGNGAGVLYNGSNSTDSQGLPKSTWVVIKIHWNGASTTIQLNNNTVATIANNIGTGASSGSSQGAASAGLPCNCNVLEHLIYTSKPSNADISDYIDKYLASKFGIW